MDHDRTGSEHPVAVRRRRERVLALIALGSALVVGFEAAVQLAAAVLFTHVDTPASAATDPFCSPDGRPGWTGGAVVIVVGNLIGLAVVVLLLTGRRRATRSR